MKNTKRQNNGQYVFAVPLSDKEAATIDQVVGENGLKKGALVYTTT